MNHIEHKTKDAVGAAAVGVFVNSILFILKLSAGIISSSVAMISDAAHSAADIASGVAILFGIKLAGRKPTAAHPYGYGKYESIAALLLSVLLFATAIGIGIGSVKNIVNGSSEINSGFFAVSVSVFSIIVKESVFRFTYKRSKALCSEALLAEAHHHRADSIASFGSLVGILGSELGVPIVDPLAGIVISLFIMRTALFIFRDSCRDLTDTAAEKTTSEIISEVTREGCCVHSIRSRKVSSQIFIELSVYLDGSLSVRDAYVVTSEIKTELVKRFPNVSVFEISAVPRS